MRKILMRVPDIIDRRVLGALRLVDHTTTALIRRPLQVTSDRVCFIRNRSSFYVVSSAPGLASHLTEFESVPSQPVVGSVQIAVNIADQQRTYLPRLMTIELPRNPDPAVSDQTGSLFQPMDVPMYRASNAFTNVNWSVIRGSVFRLDDQSNRRPIRGALLRVIRTDDDVVLARGLSDTRGELIVTVAGIPITNFSNGDEDEDSTPSGPVITSETPVRLEVIVDSALPWPVNPDVLEANIATMLRNQDQPTLLTLKTGQTATVAIEVDLPQGS
jgi:hypothetical protein